MRLLHISLPFGARHTAVSMGRLAKRSRERAMLFRGKIRKS